MTIIFSKQAAISVQYRPAYPKELYEFLIQQVPDKKLCLDSASGICSRDWAKDSSGKIIGFAQQEK
jgi:hypothetical protein